MNTTVLAQNFNVCVGKINVFSETALVLKGKFNLDLAKENREKHLIHFPPKDLETELDMLSIDILVLREE